MSGKRKRERGARAESKETPAGGLCKSTIPAAVRILSRAWSALGWPGLYGWVGIAFALSGLWFLPSGLVLRGRAERLTEGDPRAREAAESARRLGFGEGEPIRTVATGKTGGQEERWSGPFGFMVPSLKQEKSGERPREEAPDRPPPVYVVRDPLAGRSLVRARAGVEANARASIVFGVFCLAVSGFWWGFRFLDPVTRRGEQRQPTSTDERRSSEGR